MLVHLYSPHDSGLADDSACCCRSVVLVASVRGAFPAARFGVPFFRGGKNRLRVCFGDVFNLSGLLCKFADDVCTHSYADGRVRK